MQREYWEGVDETSKREEEILTAEAMIALPALEALIPEDLTGNRVLDIGPGDGARAQTIAKRGAKLWVKDEREAALDMTFQRLAMHGFQAELVVGSTDDLTKFEDESLDMVTIGSVIREQSDMTGLFNGLFRVLRPLGTVLIFVAHPVLEGGRVLTDGIGTRQWILRDYFASTGSDSKPPGMTEEEMHGVESPHTVSDYLNPLAKAGFVIEEVHEPRPSNKFKDEGKSDWSFYDRIPSYLIIQARKP